MPYLIDGYNLYHAALKFGEEWARLVPLQMCCLVAEDMARMDDHATVIFDGTEPRGRFTKVAPPDRVRIVYAGGGVEADTRIESIIGKNTAPRRLIVVSTDRQVRAAARRRRAQSLTAAQYLEALAHRAAARPPRPREPREKRHGLSAEQTRAWLAEFGFDPDVEDDPLGRIR